MTGGVATVAPGGFLALHRHAPPEIYFILEGEGCMSLDGRERPIKAGDGVFIPGNVEHGVRNEGSATLRILYVFPVDSFDEIKYVFS
jgi:quercetin dioxygenase-like cupin family protein